MAEVFDCLVIGAAAPAGEQRHRPRAVERSARAADHPAQLSRRGGRPARDARLARRLLASPALARYYEREAFPDDGWLDAARNHRGTCFHPMGTCRMGSATDPSAVVDDRLRVHGVEALCVVDASVMPIMPSANLDAATLMIAVKASDMILGRPPLPAADL